MSFSFDNIRQPANGSSNSISYFALKNDRDSALVRFMHDTVESFDVVDTHDVKIGERQRRIACTGDNGSTEPCPFCAAGMPVRQRMYVHLLQYDTDSTGKITVTPKVWDRPVGYAYKMRDFINNYGPLSDMLFVIVRNGAARDPSTSYSEMPAMPNRYPPENYPKINAFENYTAKGTAVMQRSAADMQTYLETGNFPIPRAATSAIPQTAAAPTPAFVPPATNYNAFNAAPAAPQNFNESIPNNPASPTPATPTAPTSQPTPPIQRPWETNAQPVTERPVRYF